MPVVTGAIAGLGALGAAAIAAPATAAAIVGTTAAVGATAHQVQQSRIQERAGEQMGRRQERSTQLLMAQRAEGEENAEKTKAVRVDRAAQRSLIASRQGRRSTLLTGNLGLIGEPSAERRTLLG